MTKRYVGLITIENGDNVKFVYPIDTNIPKKQDWKGNCIWEDNGKIIKPVNQDAINYLDEIVKELECKGYTHSTNGWSRKKKSIKYAIQAYSEHLKLVK